ncbi:transcription factor IIA, alpha/beta subunit [Macrolepiota fuliginosa MF-IS2]|uniref:Transcription initiation factor IIA large subunit n=1 Tax=Macrolepiota fuliginosa MF-IS2 TaxID=1400762 RepID=A0A9P5XPC2_9AGAR|nr:transcription factor IIA, alpha/beta subunit [Macrolepiota fuliginosa MF-IS2]
MSNKIVPTIYRSVIDDVIASIKSEFDEYGVSEDVLAELQNKWETKVIASHVAEFEQPQQPQQPVAPPHQPAHHSYPPHPMQHMMQAHYSANPYASMATTAQQAQVKSEPVDTRYMFTPNVYAVPALPGPNLNRNAPPPQASPHPGGQTGVISFAPPRPSQGQQPPPAARPYAPPAPAPVQSPVHHQQTTAGGAAPNGHAASPPAPGAGNQPAPAAQQQRIPQVDGPSESSGEEDSPEPTGYAPRPQHPSLPQPGSVQSTQQSTVNKDEEAINSDLDDSDTENEAETEEGGSGDTDIVFCTYDKVARVKNKWKCILKDGMIHINGKDYLFAKCTG